MCHLELVPPSPCLGLGLPNQQEQLFLSHCYARHLYLDLGPPNTSPPTTLASSLTDAFLTGHPPTIFPRQCCILAHLPPSPSGANGKVGTLVGRNLCVHVLHPFINTLRSGFGQSQTFWILTKYLWKNTNIYNIKTIALESSQSIFSYYVYWALWILIFFFLNS
jgi:hypothetical protein